MVFWLQCGVPQKLCANFGLEIYRTRVKLITECTSSIGEIWSLFRATIGIFRIRVAPRNLRNSVQSTELKRDTNTVLISNNFVCKTKKNNYSVVVCPFSGIDWVPGKALSLDNWNKRRHILVTMIEPLFFSSLPIVCNNQNKKGGRAGGSRVSQTTR